MAPKTVEVSSSSCTGEVIKWSRRFKNPKQAAPPDFSRDKWQTPFPSINASTTNNIYIYINNHHHRLNDNDNDTTTTTTGGSTTTAANNDNRQQRHWQQGLETHLRLELLVCFFFLFSYSTNNFFTNRLCIWNGDNTVQPPVSPTPPATTTANTSIGRWTATIAP